jgi:putative chitinase
MKGAQINTPARVAAFLTTLCFESWIEYDAVDGTYGTRTYAGRGLIQLTGEDNYWAAGVALGIDLIGQPDLALDKYWSARVATWYWTKARPNCNAWADAFRMGKINGAIGYPVSGSNDTDRCMVFAKVLAQLTGDDVITVDCNR